MTNGCLVEYEGGGDETRANPWLAELQQEIFAEINLVGANNAGIRDGERIWLEGPEGADPGQGQGNPGRCHAGGGLGTVSLRQVPPRSGFTVRVLQARPAIRSLPMATIR